MTMMIVEKVVNAIKHCTFGKAIPSTSYVLETNIEQLHELLKEDEN
jgi:hypothetical protein